MALLFLDFDGVMHRTPIGTSIDRYFERIALLAKWMREHTDVQIVVSSSWREQYTLSELRDLLFHDEPGLHDRVVGATPDLGRLHSRHARSAECQAWLAGNAHESAAWVAIDDEPAGFSPLVHGKHLVVCDPKVGLTQSALDQAERRLKEQQHDGPSRNSLFQSLQTLDAPVSDGDYRLKDGSPIKEL